MEGKCIDNNWVNELVCHDRKKKFCYFFWVLLLLLSQQYYFRLSIQNNLLESGWPWLTSAFLSKSWGYLSLLFESALVLTNTRQQKWQEVPLTLFFLKKAYHFNFVLMPVLPRVENLESEAEAFQPFPGRLQILEAIWN